MENFQIGSVRQVEFSVADNDKIKLSFYYNELQKFSGAIGGTPFVLYVIGTKTKRIGSATDSEIILKFLSEGYAVCVADYSGCANAKPPQLDYSVQNLLNKLRCGSLFEENTVFYGKRCNDTYVVPAGYYLSRNNVFWSFDKHSADGTFEKIINIWNNDFRSVKGETLAFWADENGNRKAVQNAFDGTIPVWCNAEGEPDENGQYIRIKYTNPQKMSDCTRKNGEPLNLDLSMDICYPLHPKKSVPVICLLSSADTRSEITAVADRPHYHGFLFRGYAGAVCDYGWTPMAQITHYGQFDGNGSPGHITGDNVTYSMQFYNDTAINTAAMRYIRYLNETDSRFSFISDSIGVIGTSKGAWATFLGMENPEEHMPHRYLVGHSGESRFESGKTEKERWVRGGEEQPFLYANGKKLSSRANFIFPACGGCSTDIFKGHSPMFVDCHLGDRSGYWNSASFAALCRDCDVPAVVTTLDLGHTMCYGSDINYGFDAYRALFDFAGFFLKKTPVRILYNSADDYGLSIKFTGSVCLDEIKKIKLYCEENEVAFKAKPSYGNTLWLIAPEKSGNIQVVIPDDLMGSNGIAIDKEYSFEYLQTEIKKNSYTNEIEAEKHSNLSDLFVEYGDFLRHSEVVIEGEASAKVTVSTNVSQSGAQQFVNHEFYHNHGPYSEGNIITVNNILGEKVFCSDDVGRRYKITVSILDTASREIQLSLSSGLDIENRIIDYNKAIRNFRTEKNKWTDFELEYTVTEPFEKSSKKLLILPSSSGSTEKPIYIGKISVLEYK